MAKNQKLRFWTHALWYVCFGLLAATAWFRFPLEVQELGIRMAFWKAGIKSVRWNQWHGYDLNSCKNSSDPSCACVLMIHDAGDHALTWQKLLLLPQAQWKLLGLDQSLRLIAIDLLGSGGTPTPAVLSEYRVRNQAHSLQESLRPLCHNWIVLGQGLGGWVASWLALDWPEGVRRLILLDSLGLASQEKELKSNLPKLTSESMQEFQKRAYFKPRPIPQWQWSRIIEHTRLGHEQEIRLAQTQEDYLDSRLPALRKPTLVFWGKSDEITPLAQGYQLRGLIPGVIWRELPDCGHFPQQECPLPVARGIIDMIHFGAM